MLAVVCNLLGSVGVDTDEQETTKTKAASILGASTVASSSWVAVGQPVKAYYGSGGAVAPSS